MHDDSQPAPPAPLKTPGYFVVFEGGDGSGKSTQVNAVCRWLESQGRETVRTREPGGTELAERIRELLLDPRHAPVDSVTEALLFAAARSTHVRTVISPALERGAVVVSDRFLDSSLAYQGVGRDLGEDWVSTINDRAVNGTLPDLTVVLDLPVDEARRRRETREQAAAGTADRIEAEGEDFQHRLREVFLRRARAAPERYLVLDARASVEELTAQIQQRIAHDLDNPDAADSTAAGGDR